MSVRVQESDFDVTTEIAALTTGQHDVGAVATFIGKVRGEAGGKPLTSMTLEHYPGMTERELARIAGEAQDRFHLSAISVVHRIGKLKPGDNIVLVIACAPHRHDAFAGAEFLMDFLKSDAPFWKKEMSADGDGTWVETRVADATARDRWQGPQDA